MKYLLDNNGVVALLKGDAGFLTCIRQHQPQDFAILSIVARELFYGAYKGHRTAQNLGRVEALRFEILDFDQQDARLFR